MTRVEGNKSVTKLNVTWPGSGQRRGSSALCGTGDGHRGGYSDNDGKKNVV